MSHPVRAASFFLGCLLLIQPSSGLGATSVSIDGKCNIFGSGHASAPGPGGSVGGGDGGGILPVEVALPPGVDRVATFDLGGTIDYGICCPANGPDGQAFSNVFEGPLYGGIAGCDFPTRGRFLAGVFLDDTEPADPAPSRLVFSDIAFTEVSPDLRQVFFLGDGWTGDGTGTQQDFHVPDGATRLFLGYRDRCSTSPNVPGCYDDNSGTVTGTVEVFEATPVSSPATVFHLRQNVPNPFNPSTTIRFDLPRDGKVELTIYDVAGRPVRRLVEESRPAGRHQVIWYGLDESGRRVASGVYLCKLEAGPYVETRRMTLLK